MKKITQKEIPIIDGDFKPSMADISVMLDWANESTTLTARLLKNKIERNLFGLLDCYTEFKKLITKHD